MLQREEVVWGFLWVDGDIGESDKTRIDRCEVEKFDRVYAAQAPYHSSWAEIAEDQKIGDVARLEREDVGRGCSVI